MFLIHLAGIDTKCWQQFIIEPTKGFYESRAGVMLATQIQWKKAQGQANHFNEEEDMDTLQMCEIKDHSRRQQEADGFDNNETVSNK